MNRIERSWSPSGLVFLSSACIMVIELVASRLIATRVGVSLHTWTAVIGVFLGGISLGNYVGGRLADRYASSRLLGVILALASLTSLLILWLNNDLHEVGLSPAIPLMVWVVLYVAAVFLLPSALLGCVAPIAVKAGVTDLERTGRTVGAIYAWSSVGSIVGTFVTGFLLIPWLGTKNVILSVACLLLLLALWFLADAPWRQRLSRLSLVVILFGLSLAGLSASGYLRSECLSETSYFCINVETVELDGRTVHELLLDRLVHSYTDLEDPTHLVYGYELTYAGLMQPLTERKPDFDAFFVGGGGYTLPRYLEATLPESRVVVAEIDPGVTQVAQSRLGLTSDTRIETHNVDARNFLLRETRPASYDLVFGDAFNDYSVPYHLTTLEFDRLVARALREEGLYLANIIDGGPHGRFLRAFVRTVQQVFPHVLVIPSTPEWRDTIRTTFVIAASRRPLDWSRIPEGFEPLSDDALRDYMALEPPLLLTDDRVPVDNLMAPVVEDSFTNLTLEPEIVARILPRVLLVATVAAIVAILVVVWLIRRRRRRGRATEL